MVLLTRNFLLVDVILQFKELGFRKKDGLAVELYNSEVVCISSVNVRIVTNHFSVIFLIYPVFSDFNF